MSKEQKLAFMKNRLATLEGSPKNIKCPGVVRKLRRQIRNMERQFQYARVAQLEEQVLHTDKVVGSNPTFGTQTE